MTPDDELPPAGGAIPITSQPNASSAPIAMPPPGESSDLRNQTGGSHYGATTGAAAAPAEAFSYQS